MYIDSLVATVPEDRRDAYRTYSGVVARLFLDHGAIRCANCWGSDVPEGRLTDFHRAVQAQPGEAIVTSWIEFPSREVRDSAWAAVMSDPRMESAGEAPFDATRAIFGGFDAVIDVKAGEHA